MKDLKVLRWLSLLMTAVLVLESVRVFLEWDAGGESPHANVVMLLFFVPVALEIVRSALLELSRELEELRAGRAKGADS